VSDEATPVPTASTPAAVAHAAAMGRRAGDRFRAEGIPTPNPFAGVRNRDDLAAAWRRAYLGAATTRRRRFAVVTPGDATVPRGNRRWRRH
jgi:hypothetical protein